MFTQRFHPLDRRLFLEEPTAKHPFIFRPFSRQSYITTKFFVEKEPSKRYSVSNKEKRQQQCKSNAVVGSVEAKVRSSGGPATARLLKSLTDEDTDQDVAWWLKTPVVAVTIPRGGYDRYVTRTMRRPSYYLGRLPQTKARPYRWEADPNSSIFPRVRVINMSYRINPPQKERDAHLTRKEWELLSKKELKMRWRPHVKKDSLKIPSPDSEPEPSQADIEQGTPRSPSSCGSRTSSPANYAQVASSIRSSKGSSTGLYLGERESSILYSSGMNSASVHSDSLINNIIIHFAKGHTPRTESSSSVDSFTDDRFLSVSALYGSATGEDY